MEKLVQTAKQFWNDESGATAVEYGMMVALIAAIIVVTVASVGNKILAAFTLIDGQL